MTIIASIFLRIESNIIGLRFFTGPLGLPGLGSGISCPKLSSIGLFLVSAILFKIWAICSNTISGLYFSNSALISSHPGLLLFLILFTANFTSSLVISSSNFWGFMLGKGVVFSCLNIFSKYFVISLSSSSVLCNVSPLEF